MTPKGTSPHAVERRAAFKRGVKAERLCAWWLRLHGYRILGRNLLTPGGEIDILARRGRTVVIVEVKRRGSLMGAGEAVSAGKRRRLSRAAAFVLSTLPQANQLNVRFDAMLVSPGRLPVHIRDAWRPGAG